jgi:Type II CAAX prenyl endopeptidase Rce1-like
MPNPAHLVRRYPMVSFAALACLFGWSPYILSALGVGADPENSPFGPVLAVLVVLACQGRHAFAAWWKRIRSWRAAPGWYALALLTPAVVHVVNVLINHGFGAPLPTAGQLSQWTGVPLTFLFMLVYVGLGEEGGWTAFAAPVLMRRHGLIGAWVILSALRIFWHLPLMIGGQMPWSVGILGNAGFQLVVLVMVSASGGTWSLAAVWHASLNAFGGSFFFTMVTGADKARLGVLLAAAYAVLAIAALVFSRRLPSNPDTAETVTHCAASQSLTPDRI